MDFNWLFTVEYIIPGTWLALNIYPKSNTSKCMRICLRSLDTCSWNHFIFYHFLIFYKFCWSIVDLQCCVSFKYTAKRIRNIDTSTNSFFRFLSHVGRYRVLSPLYYTVGTYYLFYIQQFPQIPYLWYISHKAIPCCSQISYGFCAIILSNISKSLISTRVLEGVFVGSE